MVRIISEDKEVLRKVSGWAENLSVVPEIVGNQQISEHARKPSWFSTLPEILAKRILKLESKK